ncbi:hypothetical protein HIM_05304 [Hirsutella minnesotensis 3608]|uniref:Carboxylic ester hydrolase n=1 Tax=Hirsutella minnesotensis 3608 TaxID=1043627 RepID=A0A0F7ZUS6_9HYPO|nr:hypothetical protein HIM_05304 [Hirsutella minnesotensis 3608]
MGALGELTLALVATRLAFANPIEPFDHTQCAVSRFIEVQTVQGTVVGHAADNSPCVVEYLGIPYAKPPVGDLRFAAPQRLDSGSRGRLEASRFGYDCPMTPIPPVTQYPGLTPQAPKFIAQLAAATGKPQSEDCLTLNIWSKTTPSAVKSAKPVFVYFYGGRFATGHTNSPLFTGKYFADAEDIVVVTVNYRTNIFGFPGAPGQVQNLGLRDQRVAIEWLRDNVGSFGGDAGKITIAGQSAGAVGVDYYAYAYKDDPIVSGIIAHSGTALSFPTQTSGVTERNWAAVVRAVGCEGGQDVMACMRRADWRRIEEAQAAVKSGKTTSRIRAQSPFYPLPDGQVVFADYTNLTRTGHFAHVPILFGNNDNEAGYYVVSAYAAGVVATTEETQELNLESFTCPVASQVRARRAHGVQAWAYRYLADWDNTRLYPTSGAYHGVELNMIFGTSADVTGIATSAQQQRLTRLMQRAWFNFCNDPHQGLTKFGWPDSRKVPRRSLLLAEIMNQRHSF